MTKNLSHELEKEKKENLIVDSILKALIK